MQLGPDGRAGGHGYKYRTQLTPATMLAQALPVDKDLGLPVNGAKVE